MPLLVSRSVSIVALIALFAFRPGCALALDPARRLADYSLTAWGTGEDLARFDGVPFAVFDRANTPALTHNDVQAFYESKDGALWIGLPAGWRGDDGRLYFPSSHGLVALDPRPSGPVAPAAAVLIEQVLVDGEERPLSGGILLAPATRRFEFRYTLPDPLAPERTRFSYQLEGFDAEWVDAGTARAASYTRVPAGDYRFRVRAQDEGGAPRGEPASVAVRVQARWYRTGGFFATLVIAGVAAAVAGHRLRVRYLVVRERELTRRIEETLASVKVLRGLLPICSHCKKVRDDAGYWNQLDAYVAQRSEAELSHGICPDCARSHYPDSWRRIEARRARERGDPKLPDPQSR